MKRAFTLLEVLVAVAILSLSLTSLLGSQMASLRATDQARRMSSVAFLAEWQLTEIEWELKQDGWGVDDVSFDGAVDALATAPPAAAAASALEDQRTPHAVVAIAELTAGKASRRRACCASAAPTLTRAERMPATVRQTTPTVRDRKKRQTVTSWKPQEAMQPVNHC